tara:strand:- start:1118 stop:2122 length:1005 start_codon:yes stop_codon:yes gene_type:complete
MAAVTAAVVGIGSAVVSTGMSFSAAAKAKRAGEAARKEAKQAMVDAKAKASKDFYEGLNVPLDAYEAEFENNLAVAQQNTEALQEGDARSLAAGVGRVGAAAGANAEQTRIAMGEQISDLQATKAQSKDAVNQQLLEMDVANAKEQKQIAAEADLNRSKNIQAGIAGIGSSVNAIAGAVPLFTGAGKAAKAAAGAAGSISGNMLSGLKSNQPGGLSLNSFNPGGGLGGGNTGGFGGGLLSQQQNSMFSNKFSGGFNTFTPGFNSGIYSDRRLKENIELIGKSPSGLNIYSFKYKGKKGVYQGVMSDEISPKAVVKTGEYDMVNYNMIDVEFKEI